MEKNIDISESAKCPENIEEIMNDFAELLIGPDDKKAAMIRRDFQGFPVYKMTYREILESLGFEHKDGFYRIPDDAELLDIYPVTLEDDGMGYGVNNKFITEAHRDTGIMFIEAPDETFIATINKCDKNEINQWYDYLRVLDDEFAQEIRTDALALQLELCHQKDGFSLQSLKNEVRQALENNKSLLKEFGFKSADAIQWSKYQMD